MVQGSPISPALFNIYVEDIITNIKTSLNEQKIPLYYKFYADDLVIFTHSINVKTTLKTLHTWSETYNLKINATKSAILCNRNHKKLNTMT